MNLRPSRTQLEVDPRASRTRLDGELLLDLLGEVRKQHLAEIAGELGDVTPCRNRLWLPRVGQVAVKSRLNHWRRRHRS